MEPAAMTVATFLQNVGTIFTSAIGWVATVGSTVAAEPILLTFCALPLCGIGVGFFKRLMRVD